MKLWNLFKPKLLEARVTEPSKRKEGLVYALNNYKTSGIFLYVDGQNDLLLGERWHTVSSLCVHNNWLYDGGYKRDKEEVFGFVIDTITGKDIMERKDNPVHSLCSHNGILYKGGYDGIYEVLTGKKIAHRWGLVTALCSRKGVLYDAGSRLYYDGKYYDGVYETFKPRLISKKYLTSILCSHEGTLYGIGWDKPANSFGRWILFDVLKNKKISEISGKGYITVMCSYKGEMYEGTYTGIHYTYGYKNLLTNKSCVTAMCSISSELEEQIKGSVKRFDPVVAQQVNPKGFIEYLSINTKQEREQIISQLFSCDSINEEVLDWLDKNEQDVMRKVAFH